MDPQQKREGALIYKSITHDNLSEVMLRISSLADDFTRLEVQIATILFAFFGLFIGLFDETTLNLSIGNIFLMKLAFALVLFFLIASLVIGLIHIKRKEQFWCELYGQRAVRMNKWMQVLKKEASFEEGMSFHEGTMADGGLIASTPGWTWILQTIFLAIAVGIMFILALIVIFAS